MIIVCGGIKGGSGKTTVSSNLAVMLAMQGKEILLVDADEQGTASDFASMREEGGFLPKLTTVQLQDTAVRTEVRKMVEKYDHVVVDTGGRDTTSQRAALTIADMLLIPFVPGSFDIWTAEKVDKLVEQCKAVNEHLQAYSFLNRADHQGVDNEESAEILSEMKHVSFWSDVRLGSRKSFRSAGGKGQSIVEWRGENRKRDKDAETEMQAVFAKVCDALGIEKAKEFA